jgi:hypothetical protein
MTGGAEGEDAMGGVARGLSAGVDLLVGG